MAGLKKFSTIMVWAALLGVVLAGPLHVAKHRNQKRLAAQVATTDSEVVEAKTPYPAAGFRPRIPFELPGERQPKGIPEPTTSTVATTIEDFDVFNLPALPITTTSSPLSTTTTEFVDARTPSNTYGTPENDLVNSAEVLINEVVDNNVEVVVPSQDFQPPTSEAAQDFSSTSFDGVVDSVPVVDLPSTDLAQEEEEEQQNKEISESKFAVEGNDVLTPDNTYGPPTVVEDVARQQPADTYGAPVEKTEIEENSELRDLAAVTPILSRADSLRNGRLIFIPSDGTSVRQVYIANNKPAKQVLRRRNDRLRKL